MDEFGEKTLSEILEMETMKYLITFVVCREVNERSSLLGQSEEVNGNVLLRQSEEVDGKIGICWGFRRSRWKNRFCCGISKKWMERWFCWGIPKKRWKDGFAGDSEEVDGKIDLLGHSKEEMERSALL